jgi:two-component system, sensor histidine kinase
VSTLFPEINWFLLVKTEYLSLFLITIFSTLLINRLFPELSSNIFKYLVVFINCVYTVFILFAPVIIFTRWLPLYLMTSVVVLVYAAVTIFRAMALEKSGAWSLIIGLILSIIAIGYDMIAYEGILVNQLTVGSVCYILIYLCCAVGILQQLKVIRSSASPSNTLRYQDLY